MARMDTGLFIAALALLGFGMVLVYSSSFAIAQERFGGAGFFLERQLVRGLVALVAFVLFINIDYHTWGKLSGVGYVTAIALLAIVLALPESHAVNGAKRWLTLGPVRFQVSDYARLALIVLIAARCGELGDDIRQPAAFLKLLGKTLVLCALILFEPNFSTAALLAVLALAMLYAAGARFWHVSGVVLAALPVAAAGLLAAPYRRARVLAFLGGSRHAEAVGYQAQQALIGLGNGGLFGVGLGQGRQKYFYLPEPHTDFAFSILGEEIGLVGLLVVLLLFAWMVYRGFRVALHAPDRQGQLMAFGVTLMLALHVLVHAAVNVGLAPTTGVPLPFLSYGGVSVVLTMVSFGILLNISSQAGRELAAPTRAPGERLRRLRVERV